MIWNSEKLGNVCSIISGNSIPLKKKSQLFENVKGLPYVATKDVNFNGDIKYDNGIAVPKEHINSFKISPASSTLVCAEGGSAGRKIAFSNRDCCFVNKLFSISPSLKIEPKFLYYFCLSDKFQHQFKKALSGLIGGVSLNKMKDFNFYFPSLLEQQKITLKLDNIFNKIDVSLKLTQDTIKNLNELLITIRDENFFSNESDNSIWKDFKLEQILLILPKNGKSPPKEFQSNTGTPLLTLSSVTGNIFNANKSIFTKANVDKNAHYWVENGDFLITRANTKELVGHVAIVKGISEPIMYPDLIMKMKVNEDIVLTKFLHQQLMTTKIRQYIMSNAKGANPTMVKINQHDVKNIPVKIPSLESQYKVISFFEKIENEIMIVINSKLKKIESLNKLKQSILSKEFKTDS